MAINQGMCKNCGSLIVFDEKDSQCECVFCHCVFPSEEAIEIFNHPEGRTFPNEKYEITENANKHNATKVYSTESLEKTIAREDLRKSQSSERPNTEFEVQAKDVKAPKKLVIGLVAGFVAVVALILAISFPMYKTRKELRAAIEAEISTVFDGIADVDQTTDPDGEFYNGFSVFGQTCQYLNAVTDEELDPADALAIYENYCALRAEKVAEGVSDIHDGVIVKIYCAGGYWTVSDSNGNVESFFTDDAGSTEE